MINSVTPFFPEIYSAMLEYRSTLKFLSLNLEYSIMHDASIVAHATYLKAQAAEGFHNLSFNLRKASYRLPDNISFLDPWVPYYREKILPVFKHYLNLHEIIQLMPGQNQLNITRNQLLDVARLIQFFETTRFIEASYMNLSTNFGDYPLFNVIITPAEILLYDFQEKLIAKIDLVKSKISYVGRQTTEFHNFWSYIKNLTFRFTKILPTSYAKNVDRMVRPEWNRLNFVDLSKSWSYLENKKSSKFTLSNFEKLKKEYMIKYGLDPNNLKEYSSFNFKVIALDNPFWFKWGTRQTLTKRNVLYSSLPKQPAVKALQDQQYKLDRYNTPLLFKEGLELMKEITKMGMGKYRPKRNKYADNASYQNGPIAQLYLLKGLIVEEKKAPGEPLGAMWWKHFKLPYHFGISSGPVNRRAFLHSKQRRRPRFYRGDWRQKWKRLDGDLRYMVNWLHSDWKRDVYTYKMNRFLVRNKAEFWWNHTPQDTKFLKKLLSTIRKKAQFIDAFDKNIKAAVDTWYVQERNYHLENLHKLIIYYIRAHTTYVKSKAAHFFQEVLTMDGLNLVRKMGLCKMYLDQLKLASKERNNYLIYKMEYEPAYLLYLKLEGLKDLLGPLVFEDFASTRKLKEFPEELSLNLEKDYRNLPNSKIKSIRDEFFSYFLEFKFLMKDIFRVKTFFKNGKRVQILEPRYVNKYGQGLWYVKNKSFTKQLNFFHRKLFYFLEAMKRDLEGTAHRFENDYELLASPYNIVNGYNDKADHKKYGKKHGFLVSATMHELWTKKPFKYRWFRRKQNRWGPTFWKLRDFRWILTRKSYSRRIVSMNFQRANYRSKSLGRKFFLYFRDQSDILDWLKIKWNNEIHEEDPGMLTEYDNLDWDDSEDLEESWDDELDLGAAEWTVDNDPQGLLYKKNEAIDKVNDLNTLFSLLDKSKSLINKLKKGKFQIQEDFELSQKEVLNSGEILDYEEYPIADTTRPEAFDSKYFQHLMLKDMDSMLEDQINLFKDLSLNEEDLSEDVSDDAFLENLVEELKKQEGYISKEELDEFRRENNLNTNLNKKEIYFVNKYIRPYLQTFDFGNNNEFDVDELINTVADNAEIVSNINFPNDIQDYVQNFLVTVDLGIPTVKVQNSEEFVHATLFQFWFDYWKSLTKNKNFHIENINWINKDVYNMYPNYYKFAKNLEKLIIDPNLLTMPIFYNNSIPESNIEFSSPMNKMLDSDEFIFNKINNPNDKFLYNYIKYIQKDLYLDAYIKLLDKHFHMSSDSSEDDIDMQSALPINRNEQKQERLQDELMSILNSKEFIERDRFIDNPVKQVEYEHDDLSSDFSSEDFFATPLQEIHPEFIESDDFSSEDFFATSLQEIHPEFISEGFPDEVKIDNKIEEKMNELYRWTYLNKYPEKKAEIYYIWFNPKAAHYYKYYTELANHADLKYLQPKIIASQKWPVSFENALYYNLDVNNIRNNRDIHHWDTFWYMGKPPGQDVEIPRFYRRDMWDNLHTLQYLITQNHLYKQHPLLLKQLLDTTPLKHYEFNHENQDIYSYFLESTNNVKNINLELESNNLIKSSDNYILQNIARPKHIPGLVWKHGIWTLGEWDEEFRKKYVFKFRNFMLSFKKNFAAKDAMNFKRPIKYRELKQYLKSLKVPFNVTLKGTFNDFNNAHIYLNIIERNHPYLQYLVRNLDNLIKTQNKEKGLIPAVYTRKIIKQAFKNDHLYVYKLNQLLKMMEFVRFNMLDATIKKKVTTDFIWKQMFANTYNNSLLDLNSFFKSLKHSDNKKFKFFNLYSAVIVWMKEILDHFQMRFFGKRTNEKDLPWFIITKYGRQWGLSKLSKSMWRASTFQNKNELHALKNINDFSLLNASSVKAGLVPEIENILHVLKKFDKFNFEDFSKQDILNLIGYHAFTPHNTYGNYHYWYTGGIKNSLSSMYRNEIKEGYFLNAPIISSNNYFNPRLIQNINIDKEIDSSIFFDPMLIKFINSWQNSLLPFNNISDLKLLTSRNYAEFPLWIEDVLSRNTIIDLNNNLESDNYDKKTTLIGDLIRKLKYYNKNPNNISSEALHDFEESYNKVLKLAQNLTAVCTLSEKTSFARERKITKMLENRKKLGDPNAININELFKNAAKQHIEFYTPWRKRYFYSVMLGKYKRSRLLPFPHFTPEWLDLYQFKDVILSLMADNEEIRQLHLLKVLQKQYPQDFIRPLFMAIIDRDLYSTYSRKAKNATEGGFIWRGFFTRPAVNGHGLFENTLKAIDNALLTELYSISLMREDRDMENQFISLPDKTFDEDVNLTSIELNSKLGALKAYIDLLNDEGSEHNYSNQSANLEIIYSILLNTPISNENMTNILDELLVYNSNIPSESYMEPTYNGVFMQSNYKNIDPDFDKYLHSMSFKGKDYQIIRKNEDLNVVQEDVKYITYLEDWTKFMKRYLKNWFSWNK